MLQAPLWRGWAMLERSRFMVGDAVWEKIAPLLPGKASDPGATAKDNRLFLEAVLWRVRTGVPWRGLPSDFGNWNSVFQRFRRWVQGGVFARVSRRPDPGLPDLGRGHRRGRLGIGVRVAGLACLVATRANQVDGAGLAQHQLVQGDVARRAQHD